VHVFVLKHYLMTYLGLYRRLIIWLLPQCSQCVVYFVMGGALCYWAIPRRRNKIGLGTCQRRSHVYSQCTYCFSSAALDNIFTSSVLFQYSQL